MRPASWKSAQCMCRCLTQSGRQTAFAAPPFASGHKRILNLLSGFRVETHAESGFPSSVCALADGAAALCVSFRVVCQDNLSFLKIRRIVQSVYCFIVCRCPAKRQILLRTVPQQRTCRDSGALLLTMLEIPHGSLDHSEYGRCAPCRSVCIP